MSVLNLWNDSIAMPQQLLLPSQRYGLDGLDIIDTSGAIVVIFVRDLIIFVLVETMPWHTIISAEQH